MHNIRVRLCFVYVVSILGICVNTIACSHRVRTVDDFCDCLYIYSYGIDARFGVFVQLSLWQIIFVWWTTVTHAICTRVDTKNVISFFRRWIYFYSASKYCGLLPILIFHPLSVILLSVMKDHVNKYIYIYIYTTNTQTLARAAHDIYICRWRR